MSIFARHDGVDHSMTGDDMPGMSHESMGGMKMWVHGGIGGDILWFASWQPTSAGATVGVCIGLFLLAIFDRYLHALWRACAAAWGRGKVGFALPVSKGDLPPDPSSSSSSSANTTNSFASSSAVAVAKLALDPIDTPVRRAVPSTTPAPVPGSCCAKSADEEKDALALEAAACDCGCGGECGSSSQPSGCCGTGNCVPDYRETSSPRREQEPLSYLPASVRKSLDPQRKGRWSRPFRLGADVPRGLLYMLLSLVHFAVMLVVMTFQIWWILSVVVGLGVGEMLFGRFGGER